MSYQYSSKADLLALINSANGTTYLPTDLQFAAPQVVAGTWRDIPSAMNTAVRVTADPASAFQGTTVVLYDRLNLAALSSLPGLRSLAPAPVTVNDLIPGLKYYNGLDFAVGELVDSAIINDGSGNLSAVLTAAPGSIGWVGSVTIPVKIGGTPLDSFAPNTALPGLNYPTANDADIFGSIYLYGYDFTTYFSLMSTLPPGALATDKADLMVTALKALDVSSGALLWNNDPAQTLWSLNGATVLSNGINDPINLPTNPAYKYVMAIALHSRVFAPAGTLYLHYNDPFDPNAT